MAKKLCTNALLAPGVSVGDRVATPFAGARRSRVCSGVTGAGLGVCSSVAWYAVADFSSAVDFSITGVDALAHRCDNALAVLRAGLFLEHEHGFKQQRGGLARLGDPIRKLTEQWPGKPPNLAAHEQPRTEAWAPTICVERCG